MRNTDGTSATGKMHYSMVTAVSEFIEQVGSMIKEFQNNYHPSSFKELAQTLVCYQSYISSYHPFAGYYQFQNLVIANK